MQLLSLAENNYNCVCRNVCLIESNLANIPVYSI